MGRRNKRLKHNIQQDGDPKLRSNEKKKKNCIYHSPVNDPIHDPSEQYHNAKDALINDILRFDEDEDEQKEDDGVTKNIQPVLDLVLSQSEDDSVSDDSSLDEDEQDFDDESDIPMDEAGNWGKRKKNYYHGDTADLEIGQDAEDVDVEEEGAQEILKARYSKMDESDFSLPQSILMKGNIEDDKDKEASTHTSDIRKIARNFNPHETMIYIVKNFPEVLPMLQHFTKYAIQPCEESLKVWDTLVGNQQDLQEIGTTPLGIELIHCKTLIQLSLALNVCQYLLLYSHTISTQEKDTWTDIGQEPSPNTMHLHPIVHKLNTLEDWRSRLCKVEKKKGIREQIGYLLEAIDLMKHGDLDDEEESEGSGHVSIEPGIIQQVSDEYSNEWESDQDKEKLERQQTSVINTRFAIRPEDGEKVQSSYPKTTIHDFGDDQHSDSEVLMAGKYLSSTLNTISQRRMGRNISVNENTEDMKLEFSQFREREKSLNDDMREIHYKDEDGKKSTTFFTEDRKDNFNEEDNNSNLYQRISKHKQAKKEYKKKLYLVEPKYPKWEEEQEGERPLQSAIMRNRGLTAHKNKLNRNPRVKKREQYRKALIRRKGAVRDLRVEEAHKYSGEVTGIKSRLSRSQKFTNRG